MLTRRSHNKSRHGKNHRHGFLVIQLMDFNTGCSNCKRRRVKCDEQRPFCKNCEHRHDECVYNAEGPYFFAEHQSRPRRKRSSASQSHEALPTSMFDASSILNIPGAAEGSSVSSSLNMEQLELVIQWMMQTHELLARNEETRKVWEMAVLQEGLRAPFLMHGILAVSALHLSHIREPEQAKWLGVALSHKSRALSVFSAQLLNIDQSNAKAMVAFAGLVVVFGLGAALIPGNEVGPSFDTLLEIFTLARGMQTVLSEEFQFIKQSDFAPLFDITPPKIVFPPDILKAFNSLDELNIQFGQQSTHHKTTVYQPLIKELRELATFSLALPTSMTLVGGWAIRAPKEFINALISREPFALVLLAHFCGLLHISRENWCVGAWGRIVLEEVYHLLPLAGCSIFNGQLSMLWESEAISYLFQQTVAQRI
ncbi:uncharacterized protein N7511_001616 [Penicillium nucicola]|uniref:uncharacterized protein n=1 Tax=Penicillium nucicola TaxID=1850975 RepID=UPI0025452FFC|nr:uncharacterized protein N7511_001616 [Penicillium nucicola]KAJ5776605.1 hypothetical protein N7511_001616 [Penicillium nucicola]